MTPDEFRVLGARLYGANWHAPMAEALDINPRTLRRWASGENAIGPEITARIRALQRTAPPRPAAMSPDQFRAWRHRLNLTQAQAAELLDISVSRLADYERGMTVHAVQRPAPIPRVVALACAALEHGLDPE